MRFDLHKHHRRSIRLLGCDYSKCGAYFVTICTRHGDCLLTHVGVALAATPDPECEEHATEFPLTVIGSIVNRNWLDLRNRFPTVTLDEYLIMPNHLHGIVVIHDVDKTRRQRNGVAVRATPTLGTIVGAFKSKSVTEIIEYVSQNGLGMVGKI